MRPITRPTGGRAAFTLIELLVVIVLVMVLAGIVVMFLPRALDSNRAALAGTMVQNSLQIARSRALREQAPRGIRLVVDITTDSSGKPKNLCREMVYIEQPDDFTGGWLSVGPDKVPTSATFGQYAWVYLTDVVPPPFPVRAGIDLRNNSPPPNVNAGQAFDMTLWSVLPGDFLEVFGTGQVRQIVPLPPPYPNTAKYLMDIPFAANHRIGYPIEVWKTAITPATSLFAVKTPFPNAIGIPPAGLTGATGLGLRSTPPATTNYRIIRAPRVTGEEPILLPDGTAIDLNTNWLPPPPPTQPPPPFGPYGFANLNPLPQSATIDILFAPNGRVLSPTVTQDFIALWVRDTSTDTPTNWNSNNAFGTPGRYYFGEPSIIGIHVGSGAVVANDPDQTLDRTYPPNPPGWAPPALAYPWWMRDPYSFMKEGRSAGK